MKTQTLKIKVQIGTKSPYEIDTGLEVPKEMEYYYLADDYKDPSRVRLIDYRPCEGVENKIYVLAVIADDNNKMYDISPSYLFSTKNEASDFYLNNKYKFNCKEVSDENN